MHAIRVNLRLVLFAVGALALVLASGNLGPHGVAAADPDPTGVFCGNFTGAVSGITLVRFDHNFDTTDGNPDDVALTAVAYVNATADCQTPQSALGVDVVPQSANRPTIPESKWDSVTNTLTGSLCQQNVEFAGIPLPGWSLISFDITFNKTGKTVDTNAFELRSNQVPETCGDTAETSVVTVGIDDGTFLDGPGGDPSTFTSDWDKDGDTDWEELAPFAGSFCLDPFNPDDFLEFCAGVGGIAELPDSEVAPLETGGSSGPSAGLIAAVTAAASAAALAVGGAAWYARRRWVRVR